MTRVAQPLILVRHADAEGERPETLGDFGRALTALGRRQAQDTGAYLASRAVSALGPRGLILASPLTRTLQTAEILAAAGQPGGVQVALGLRPGQPSAEGVALALGLRQPAILVGHSPTLGEIAAALLDKPAFAFDRGACLVLGLGPVTYRVPFAAP